jgi:L-glyceraldehyde 3-phosphate reductase
MDAGMGDLDCLHFFERFLSNKIMYVANPDRYDSMQYARCGRSGLKLPKISLGLWHNFGDVDDFENARALLRTAFDHGITHFDLANNYGPAAGSAERNFGKIFEQDFQPYRDELIISSKAGYHMWKGPYGEWGSRKYMLASLDQSLARMGIDYVDIFYSHRFDPETPLLETMGVLDTAVRSGRALYVGISNYPPEATREAVRILRELGTPCLIHQPSYNIFDRSIEDGLTDVLRDEGIGSMVFCPLAQGLLTDKYLNAVPADSRAAKESSPFLNVERVRKNLAKIKALNEIAVVRGQSLAQMALAWVLRDPVVTSALIGASCPQQISDNIAALKAEPLNKAELQAIDEACALGCGPE